MGKTPKDVSKMPAENLAFEEVIDSVSDAYRMCVDKAKQMFTEESAIQSASATMFINATKEKSSVDAYLKSLKDRIAKVNSEAIPSALEVWKWHFRDYISEFGPRITSAIHFYLSQNMSCEELEAHVKDRYLRLKEAQKPVDGKKDEPAEPPQEQPMKKAEDVPATDKPKTIENGGLLTDSRVHIATSPKDFIRSVMNSPVFTEPDDEYFSGFY